MPQSEIAATEGACMYSFVRHCQTLSTELYQFSSSFEVEKSMFLHGLDSGECYQAFEFLQV
jgi:hypothetical protein